MTRIDPAGLALLATVLGAVVGSFLNVVIYRLPRGLSVTRPARSFCPACYRPIPWYRNLPVITWILQNGRCAACGASIPVRYVLVEASTALLAGLLVYRRLAPQEPPSPLVLVVDFALLALFVAIAVIDWQHTIIPDPLTVPWIPALAALSWIDPDVLHGHALDAARRPDLAPWLLGATAGVAVGALPALFADWLGRPRRSVEDEAAEAEEPFSLRREVREFLRPLLLPAAVGALVGGVALEFLGPPRGAGTAAALASLAGAGVGMAFVFLVRFVFSALFGREAMGLGDAKFLGLAGASFGAEGAMLVFFGGCLLGTVPAFFSLIRRMPLATLALLLAVALPFAGLDALADHLGPGGALAVGTGVPLAALWVFLRRFRRSGTEPVALPFGPFLVVAALLLLLAGPTDGDLVGWVASRFLPH